MKKVGILLLTGTLLLCSCGQAKETAENSADVPETIQTNLTANPYFDISDLTYDGTETQNIAIGYSFEDPADNDPVLTYDRYLSADGETFCFDADGRLCKYEKGDADTAEKAESGSMTAGYTMAQSRCGRKPAGGRYPTGSLLFRQRISGDQRCCYTGKRGAVLCHCGCGQQRRSASAQCQL